jgi:hypothetical protein
MNSRPCPSAAELEAFTSGGDRSSGLAEHIQDCPICRKSAVLLEAEEALIGELQAASRTTVTERVRKRLLAVCRRVAAEKAKGDPRTS